MFTAWSINRHSTTMQLQLCPRLHMARNLSGICAVLLAQKGPIHYHSRESILSCLPLFTDLTLRPDSEASTCLDRRLLVFSTRWHECFLVRRHKRNPTNQILDRLDVDASIFKSKFYTSRSSVVPRLFPTDLGFFTAHRHHPKHSTIPLPGLISEHVPF